MTAILTRIDDNIARSAAALKNEFAALAQRTPDVLGFLMRYPQNPKEPVWTEPSFGPPLIALGRSYSAYLRRVPSNAKNLKCYEQGELLKGKGRELFEPPKPVGLLPLSPSMGCLYFYGDAEGHRHFANIAEEAGALTRRPLSLRTWHEFLFDWAIGNGHISWMTAAGHTFTKALNLPRASVQAIATLSPNPNGDSAFTQGSQEARNAWNPPEGYVGRKTICTHARFQKNGKNPAPTTIDGWVKSAKNNGQTIDIVKDPANQENHYPNDWIRERISTWNPRTSAT